MLSRDPQGQNCPHKSTKDPGVSIVAWQSALMAQRQQWVKPAPSSTEQATVRVPPRARQLT